MAAQFESYVDPFSIILSLPLAIIGAILALLVMRSDLRIMSQPMQLQLLANNH